MIRPLAVLALLAIASPATAQSPAPPLVMPDWLPAPADTGKPHLPPPRFDQDRPACAPPLPCGTRLLGTVRKNGAVEVQVPALRW